ncbi:MAG: tetratricopeptide repeat protein [Archangiaceae bacterium]|nr:tetratricopeptide repeat protein [Archangiaceae bacterium]
MIGFVALMLAAAPHQARLADALELEKQGADAQALEKLEALVVTDPTWDLARLEAARVRLKVGTELERASWHADIARSLAPENPRAHYLWALAQDENGNPVEATRSLEVALSLRADFPDARFRLAGLLSAQRRWPEAVIAWRTYVESMPAATGARLQLAQALEQSGDLKGAETELRGLLKVEPLRPVATRRLADLLDRSGHHDEASRLRRSLEQPGRTLRPLKPSAR